MSVRFVSGHVFRRAEKEQTKYRASAPNMAIPLRHANPANITARLRTFFVTSSIAAKRGLLQSDRAATLFIDVLYDYRSRQKYFLHDFVVMPNHFHVLITVGPDLSIERAVQFIKGGFAFRAGKEIGFVAPVWERGLSEVRVSHPKAAARIREYIIENPVLAGLAFRAVKYEYSSAHPAFELDELPPGLKPRSDMAGAFGTSKDVP